jgi:hypothetical protein
MASTSAACSAGDDSDAALTLPSSSVTDAVGELELVNGAACTTGADALPFTLRSRGGQQRRQRGGAGRHGGGQRDSQRGRGGGANGGRLERDAHTGAQERAQAGQERRLLRGAERRSAQTGVSSAPQPAQAAMPEAAL